MNVAHEVLGADVPLYHQIYLHVRAEIEDGIWIGRDDFPGENELARRFNVSVITSRKALNRLTEEGWIERGRGRKTRVIRLPRVYRRAEMPEIIQTVAKPRTFSYRLLERKVDVAPMEACLAFGLDAGSKLWLCSRLRSFEGKVHSVTLNAQPVEQGKRLALAKLNRLPMTQILRESGVELSTLRRTIGAVLAPPHVARHLGLTLNDPTLVYTFICHNSDNQIVQWVRIWVHPEHPGPEEILSYDTGTWSTM